MTIRHSFAKLTTLINWKKIGKIFSLISDKRQEVSSVAKVADKKSTKQFTKTVASAPNGFKLKQQLFQFFLY